MLDFSDKPYQFFPPVPNRLVIALAKAFNHRFVLPGHKHRITNIEVRNADRLAPLVRSNARFLLLPNHSTHSDPHLMLEVQRQLRVNSATMAAYDVFLRGKRQAWFMQHIGCFSVDREGSDSQAMKCAVDVLLKGDLALTIFSEGNVVLMNDKVTPFLGGAAFIGMRAQKKLGPEKPVYAIPVSMKFSHLTDVRENVINHVIDLEDKLGIKPSDNQNTRRRLRQLGLQILTRNLRQRGYMPPASENHVEDLNQLLEASAVQIISKLEEKIELTAAASDLPMDRIRRVRTAIHRRIDESKQLDHRVAATWADEAILAMRILSYSGNYLSQSPTLDRHSETLEMLREDLIEEFVPPIGDRTAIVQLGEPINLADQLEALSNNSRQTLAGLTQQFEQAVQQGLNDVGSTLETFGVATL